MTNEAKLRHLITVGLARRYTLRARAEGSEFIIEGIEEPKCLLGVHRGVNSPSFLANAPVILATANAAASRVIDRVQFELKIIEQAGLPAYFLLVADCARYGRSIGAGCFAPGSTPSSMVNYLLEISTVDPIRHGLIFERFWHPKRNHLLCVFLEFASDRLDEVIKYAKKECGGKSVAHIATDIKSNIAFSLPTLGLLGADALIVLRRTCERVRQVKGTEVLIDQIPLNDATTYKLLKSGYTDGIFQLEHTRMRNLCRKLKPTTIEHISTLSTAHPLVPYCLEPPGLFPEFIARRHGRMDIKYPHPSLEPVLRETYGMLVYQEQLMKVAQIMAGYTGSSADLLRRSLGRRNQLELTRHRQHFVSGAKGRNGISLSAATRMFDWLDRFSCYGSNKSHAIACATLTYQTAYLKANYAAEFHSA